jgi:hypothetical protein
MNPTEVRAISVRSLRKANYVIRELSRYYFPLYDIAPEDYFTFASVLLYCEGVVFDVDVDLESNQELGLFERVLQRREAIAEMLDQEGLLDGPIAAELDNLVEYARLEHRLLRSARPTREDLERACALRTSDIRMLHRVLVRMPKRPYDEEVFALLWPLEAIMDLELDLEDYHRDLAQGSFNTLAWLERMVGPEQAAAELQAQLQEYEVQFFERLADAWPRTQDRFQRLLERYQADHPRPEIGAAPSGTASLVAEPRWL